jgi:cytochrome c oxidase subunit 2
MGLRQRLTRWGTAPLLILLSALLFGGCGPSGGTSVPSPPNTLNPAGPVADREAGLFWFILIVATIVFVGVTGVLLYSIVRFRERPGMPAPRQTHGYTPIEIIWTIIPSVILFIVLGGTIYTMASLAEPASANTLTVTAIGHQWWWEFRYPGSPVVLPTTAGEIPVVATGDELRVPINTVVHVDLQSDNVIHSLWIAQLTGKTDVVPGHNNHMWFEGTRLGTYRGECAEYCGTQHAHMDFVVVVVSQADFTAWIAQQEANAFAPTTAGEQAGMQDFLHLGCVSCHAIDGTTAQEHIGPNLTHFGSRLWIAGGVLDNTPDNLAAWLNDPQAIKPGNDMVLPQPLNPQQINELVQYLESLK